ncbi:transmembrane protein 241 [Synchiropus splendidus]|uniref:transmembrane protein 241 n=1 Tax=Synchiropus splendidus TaxID=270530 RepID=UPI00237D4EFB|nr:transmembrane protein 241 [Synchiropus splendidus]
MQWKRHFTGLAFIFVFVVSYFTNKFVLSVLKFTYPTLFQGWQTFVGAFLLLLSGKLGWVEMTRISRSSVLSWLPGSFLFVGNIYAGSRALSRLDIPYFFTLQNSSHVVSQIIRTVVHREKMQRLQTISIFLMLISAINLPHYDPQFDVSSYMWAAGHLFCVGAYRVFQVHHKSINLSDIEQQCINYLFSVLLLAVAAHPTGDLKSALEFPSLQSHTFHCGCCASALLGFLLLLATVKLKTGSSCELFAVWIFLSKVTAMSLSPLIFTMDANVPSVVCVMVSHAGEALLVYSEREARSDQHPTRHTPS